MILKSHLVHGYASDPPVLLEDFLHISLHDLERVQVPNKNPVEINALGVRGTFFQLLLSPEKKLTAQKRHVTVQFIYLEKTGRKKNNAILFFLM